MSAPVFGRRAVRAAMSAAVNPASSAAAATLRAVPGSVGAPASVATAAATAAAFAAPGRAVRASAAAAAARRFVGGAPAAAAGCRNSVLGRRRISSTPPPAAAAMAAAVERQELFDEYVPLILKARVYDVARETPLTLAKSLSASLKNNVLLKREDLQEVFSFKLRGAYNKIVHLTEAERAAGIVACSAGNHAQGVALAAARLGVEATIVMPVPTPRIKVDAVLRHGARVVLHGDSFDDAKERCAELATAHGYTYIAPFDDRHVIAGQGTIGQEILKQTTGQNIDAIFVCCGGGGMIAGIAAYVKNLYPDIKVIGVEPHDAAAMTLSCANKRIVELDHVGLFAEGVAVKRVGDETFRLCNALVDEWVNVGTDEICAAIKDGFNDTRTVLEPAGALGIAGVKNYVSRKHCEGKTFVCITSGANMNFEKLRFVSERADETEASVFVSIPETPGSFGRLYNCVHPRAVTEFTYRYHKDALRDHKLGADIYMSFRVAHQRDLDVVMGSLEGEGFRALNVQGNEMAKEHARYLVGGRASSVHNERVFRFEFPERPGALNNFLTTLGARWNVSLFHYRNHGHDVGRVLVGIQVEETENEQLSLFLAELGFNFVDESYNPVYRQFLVSKGQVESG